MTRAATTRSKSATEASASGGGKSTPYADATSGPSPLVTFDVVRGMIQDSETKMASKIESIETTINSRLEKLDHLPSNVSLFFTAAGAALTVFLAVIAILAWGGDRFDGGVQMSQDSAAEIVGMRELTDQNSRAIQDIAVQLDMLLDRLIAPLTPEGQ